MWKNISEYFSTAHINSLVSLCDLRGKLIEMNQKERIVNLHNSDPSFGIISNCLELQQSFIHTEMSYQHGLKGYSTIQKQ